MTRKDESMSVTSSIEKQVHGKSLTETCVDISRLCSLVDNESHVCIWNLCQQTFTLSPS